jgi:nucleotide-binding universal stress UspA family protein
MSSTMKIIYGTDFSASTSRAGRLAASLARKLGDGLVVAHVVDPPSFFTMGVGVLEEPMMREMTAKAGELVGSVAAGLRVVGDRPIEQRVLVGQPDEMLAELAEREGARMIVVGTRGRTGSSALGRLLVGTVAERLVRSCRRPVLVVPEGPAAAAQPSGLDALDRPLEITVAIDRGVASGMALDFVRALQKVSRCSVSFVQVFSPSEERTRLGLEPDLAGPDADADIVAILENELRPAIADFSDSERQTLRFLSRRADEPDPLGRAAAANHADLLVVGSALGSQGRSARSRALDTIRSASVPVLSIGAAPSDLSQARSSPGWRSVLAATDLSREGNAAVAEAYRLLSGTGGVVELCLVQDPELHPRVPENWAELQKQLWSLVPAAAEPHGIVTRTSVLEGRPPSEKLLQAADRLGVDALVLGVGHRGGLARALMGSIVDSVISHSSKPVVLVPAPRGDR